MSALIYDKYTSSQSWAAMWDLISYSTDVLSPFAPLCSQVHKATWHANYLAIAATLSPFYSPLSTACRDWPVSFNLWAYFTITLLEVRNISGLCIGELKQTRFAQRPKNVCSVWNVHIHSAHCIAHLEQASATRGYGVTLRLSAVDFRRMKIYIAKKSIGKKA